MIACARCGFKAPDDFAFCPKCGGALAPPLPTSEERKVVTTLFCDLVGFTAMSESADPEDTDALLARYHEAARKVIDSHGGTVEKFIGDAVVGVFGVPAVHEDDAERAVRAGLRILEALDGMSRPDGAPLEARCGANTGEALVRLDVDPASGRGFLTGDAVNTAARLQAAAPPGGVAVGALTHDLTAHVIGYEELPPVIAKGKAEPVAAWRAVAALARRGVDTTDLELTPLVGRDVELAYLSALFDKVSVQRSPQFALLVGEPGIGKSRLVRELLALVDARPEMTVWRQGYCPPFGENIVYGALADIVKGHAGIRDSDDVAVAEAKLEAILPADSDRDWYRQRLSALVGLDAPESSREQNFAAWLRFFEDLAAQEPTVLVFEDLHWADEALLAFLEYATTRLAAVPLLIVGTARPELFERHPSFASGSSVTRIGLAALTNEETARLVTGLLGQSDDGANAVKEVVERCDGNPFYAEQSARLLLDEGSDGPLPESVQAVIAARLDTLPVDQKALLSDAAVIGSVFWEGAVTAMGTRERVEVDDMLTGLLERRLIRRIRESSLDDEREYAFAHALARDVAYGQLPRVARSRRHVAACEWLEQKMGARATDLAEVLAYHLATAFALAEASRQEELAAAIRVRTVSWLRAAGDRAQSVDVAVARKHYTRALEIALAGDADRPDLLLSLGEMLTLGGEYSAAVGVLEEAEDLFRSTGDPRGLIRTLLRLQFALSVSGSRRPELGEEALALARSGPPSQELVDALTEWGATQYFVSGDPQVAVDAINEAERVCEQQGFALSPWPLASRGGFRCALGDAAGLADFRRAVEMARNSDRNGYGFELSSCMSSLAVVVDWVEGPAASLRELDDCIRFCERRGMLADAAFMRITGLELRLTSGDWVTLSTDIANDEQTLAPADQPQNVRTLAAVKLMLPAWQGRLDGLPEALASTEAIRPDIATPWEDAYDAVPSSVAAAALGLTEAAEHRLSDWAATPETASTVEYAWMVPCAVRTALSCSGLGLADRLRHRGDGRLPVQQHIMVTVDSLLDEASGKHEAAWAGFASAAGRWHEFGVPYEEGQALLGQGRCLVALDRARDAAAPLAAAREIFARLGAKPALAEIDQLFARTSRA